MSARPTDLLRLRAIVASIQEIEEVVSHYGISRSQYVEPEGIDESVRRSAIDFYMTQLCEEAREITDETRRRMPDIPWSAIAETRTFFVHVYSAVNPNISWETIQDDLPTLKQACEKCISEIETGLYVPSSRSRSDERASTLPPPGSGA